ncbi:MAG: hypothetical protein ACKO5L_08655 [Bacteroidota bacterium]
MIEELTKLLNEDVKAFTHGEAGVQRLDHAIKTAQEITEKLIILRYKAYEAGLFSSPEEPSPRQEFDLDLSPMGDEESTTINVEDSVHNQESKATDNTPSSNPENDAIESMQALETVLSEPETMEEEPPNSIETSVADQTTMDDEPVLLQQESSPEEVRASFDLMTLITQSKGKHEKIDAFNGNYSLKEKITFINALFGGSSESFGTAVKQIDGYKSLEETIPTLEFLASTFRWDQADTSTLNRCMEKLVAKYA